MPHPSTTSTDYVSQQHQTKNVVIIGGGFSGASLASHLAAITDPAQCLITIIEPRDNLGAGLAYSTHETSFRLNVLSDRMSLFYDDKPHFARWMERHNALADDSEAKTENDQIYARRSTFGAYMADQLRPLLNSGQVQHIHASATGAIKHHTGGYRITTDSNAEIHADYLVIAASHPLPALPAPIRKLTQAQPDPIHGLVTNPYEKNAIAQLLSMKGKSCSVLIVGAGLTSADMIAGLTAHGHSGKITVLSRHGLRSRPNLRPKPDAPAPQRFFGDFLNPPAKSAVQLLRNIRQTIDEAARQCAPWQAVIDMVRNQGDAIWQALPLIERKRVVRHLRTYWDAHRFRLATQTDDVLEARQRDHTLEFIAAHLNDATLQNGQDQFSIQYRLRGKTDIIRRNFDAVIITTGPSHGDIISQCPPLAMLHQAGLVTMDPTGLGLHTSRQDDATNTMRAISCCGTIIDDLFIAGPLARGTFGELMGAPEVTRYTQALAQVIIQALQKSNYAADDTSRTHAE